ncbi:MAG: sulfide-dependent adenosine diphosphate thiazole synthase [Planctomycetota bacterium]
MQDTAISRAIAETYHEKLTGAIESDVLITGGGPSGLVAAAKLASSGYRVTVLEKRLAPGGGVWGGAMGMNIAIVQDEAVGILDEFSIGHQDRGGSLHSVEAGELAAGLCVKAIQNGATFLNLLAAEDVCVHNGRVVGVVANQSMVLGQLPVDPLTLSGSAVLDATGHEAALVNSLRKRGLLPVESPEGPLGEGPMDADAGERFVVENTSEVFPGMWVSGMAVCATLGGPRMGPIFGGMLMSGVRVAEQMASAIGNPR